MIQPLLITLGVIILSFIFLRRFFIMKQGGTTLRGMGRHSAFLRYFHHFHDNDNFEVTVEELIPDISSVDPKKVAKADTIAKRADIFMEQGDLKEAEKLLIQSLSLDPSRKDAYHKLGLIYLKQGQYGKAELMYRKLIVSFRDDPVYFSNLGVALYQQKKLEEAKSFYQEALGLDASRAGRFFSIGQICLEMQQTDEALTHFLRALQMEPRNLDYLLSIAQFYIDRQMPGEAKKLLDDVLTLFPGNEIAKEMKKSCVEKPQSDGPNPDAPQAP